MVLSSSSSVIVNIAIPESSPTVAVPLVRIVKWIWMQQKVTVNVALASSCHICKVIVNVAVELLKIY